MKVIIRAISLLSVCLSLGAQEPILFDPCQPLPACAYGTSILACAEQRSPVSWLIVKQSGGGPLVQDNLGNESPVTPEAIVVAPDAGRTQLAARLPSHSFSLSSSAVTAFSVEAAFAMSLAPPDTDVRIVSLANYDGLPLVEIGVNNGAFYFKRASAWGQYISESNPASYYRVKLWDPNPTQYVSDWHHLFVTLRADGQLQIDDFQYGPAPGYERHWYSFTVEGGNVSTVSGGSASKVAQTVLPTMRVYNPGNVMGYLGFYQTPLTDSEKLRIMAASGQYSNTQLTYGMKPDNTGCYQRFQSSTDRSFLDPLANPFKTPSGLASGTAFPWNVQYCGRPGNSCGKPEGWQDVLTLTGSGGYFAVSHQPGSSATAVCPLNESSVNPAGGQLCGIGKSPELNWTGGFRCGRGETCQSLDGGPGVALWWDYDRVEGVTKPFRGSFPCTAAFFKDVPNVSVSEQGQVECTALGTAHPPSGPTGFGFLQSSNNDAAPFTVPASGMLTYPLWADVHQVWWVEAGSQETAWPSLLPNTNHYFAPTSAPELVPAEYLQGACVNGECLLNNPGGVFDAILPKRWILATFTIGSTGTRAGILKAFRTRDPVQCNAANFPLLPRATGLKCYEAKQ